MEDIYKDYSKRYKYLYKVINDQWKRFHEVYLNEPQKHHSYRKSKHSIVNSLWIGDAVLNKVILIVTYHVLNGVWVKLKN